MEKDNKGSTSLGFGTILFLIFLTLKLAGIGVVANWSWWWVFSPILIPIAALLVIFIVIGIVTYINKNL
jgi:fatty acid desaturase